MPFTPPPKPTVAASAGRGPTIDPSAASPVARKTLNCILKPFADAVPIEFWSGIDDEARKDFLELGKTPLLGKSNTFTSYHVKRRKTFRSGEQVTLRASARRDESSGEILLNVQYSATKLNPSDGEGIVKISASGVVNAVDLDAKAKSCLGL